MKHIITLILVSIVFNLSAQLSYKELIDKGLQKLKNNKYEEASDLLLKADSIEALNPKNAFNLALALIKVKRKELNAIKYFERALRYRKNNELVIRRNLGMLYHKNFLFDKAIEQFTKYLDKASDDDKYIFYCEHMLDICNNARKVFAEKTKFKISQVGFPLNNYNIKSVFVNVDGSILYFQDKDNSIYRSISKTGFYKKIKKLFIDEQLTKAQLVNISQDGNLLFFRIKKKNNYDLYYSTIRGLTIEKPKSFSSKINSKFNEYDISMSSDGTTIYFSSDRPGGYGKLDLYKAYLLKDNRWSDPENMGPEINTSLNERNPFIHASNKIFYFSSEGHKNIGGYDIFKSKLVQNIWSKPENVAFVNTIYDDLSLSQTGSGNLVLFAKPKDFDPDIHKIWQVNLSQNIPLTIVKGTIKGGKPLKPVDARIKVYKHGEKKPMRYIYNPVPGTGKYLLIFPPGQSYDMLIKSKDFLPQLIEIKVPDQTYFYQLFQEINLNPIKLGDKKIGEKVDVENVFYDIYSTNIADSLVEKYNKPKTKNYDHLLEMVEDIINTTDSLGVDKIEKNRDVPKLTSAEKSATYDNLLNLIEGAIKTTDSVTLNILDSQTLENEKTSDIFFYNEKEKNKGLIKTIVGNDTIYSKPKIKTEQTHVDNNPHKKIEINYRRLLPNQKKIILTKTLYFDINEVKISSEYMYLITQLEDFLYDNPSLGVEIHGYADEQGSDIYNMQLSRRRANEVYKKIHSNTITSNRLIIKAHGEIQESSRSKKSLKKARRVDIIVFEPQINKN